MGSCDLGINKVSSNTCNAEPIIGTGTFSQDLLALPLLQVSLFLFLWAVIKYLDSSDLRKGFLLAQFKLQFSEAGKLQ